MDVRYLLHCFVFFFQAEDGIRDLVRSRGLGDVYKRQALNDWVKAGGGFMTLIGYGDPTELTNANTLLGAFAMNYGAMQILSLIHI